MTLSNFSVLLLMPALWLSIPCTVSRGQDFVDVKQDNWHQWRGPEANGVSETARPPIEWSEDQNVQWKVPIDGRGGACPIIWQDKVFLLTAIDTGFVDPSLTKPEDQPERMFGIKFPNTKHQFVVLCLDRQTGNELWRQVATEKVPHEGHHGDNDFAPASPTTDGQRLYCWFGSAGLYCYDLDGEQIWQRDLGQVTMPASLGEGCSPVVFDDKLVVLRDQEEQSYLLVLDAATGETIWRQERDEPGSWATPYVVEHDGRAQVIASGANMVRSYDLATGELLWRCGGLTSNAIPSPVAQGDTVYCMTGYQGFSLLALPLDARGDISGSEHVRWTKSEDTPYIASPLIYNGKLYFNRSREGILSCLDAETGEPIFPRERLQSIRNLYASPVAANGHIFLTGRDGTTMVLKQADKYQLVATNELDDSIDSSVALAGKQLFLRGERFLYCLSEAN